MMQQSETKMFSLNYTAWRFRSYITHLFFVFLFLGLIFAGCFPLAVTFHGLQIFTPYLVLFVWGYIIFLVWLLRSKRKRLLIRKEEWAFVLSPVLIVFFSIASINPSYALIKSATALYAAIVFLIVRFCLMMRLLKRNDILMAAIVLFFFLSILAIFQYILQEPFGVVPNYFGENNSQESRWVGDTLRISGPFGNANVFAQVYTIYSAIVVLYFLYYFRSTHVGVALLISGVTFFVVAGSLSRSSMLFAIISQMLIYAYWMKYSRLRIINLLVLFFTIITVLAITVGSLIFSESIQKRTQRFTGFGNSAKYRIDMAYGALRLLQEPRIALLGVGSGQFFQASAAHGINYNYKSWLEPSEIHSSVHNWPLQIATENGLIVLFLYIYGLFKSAKRGWELRKLPHGWLGASLAIVLVTLYMTALQFGTSGTSPWILTPVAVILAWIQNEYDEIRKRI